MYTESVTPVREVYLMFPALLVLQPRGPEFCDFFNGNLSLDITSLRSLCPERVPRP